MMLSSDAFESAVKKSTQLSNEPGNEDKLKLYALYKQATVGENNTKKPGMLDIVGKYKWDAWKALGSMSQDDAKKKYTELVSHLSANDHQSVDVPIVEQHEDTSVAGMAISNENGVLKMRLNNPRKRNPITVEVFFSNLFQISMFSILFKKT